MNKFEPALISVVNGKTYIMTAPQRTRIAAEVARACSDGDVITLPAENPAVYRITGYSVKLDAYEAQLVSWEGPVE